MTNPKGCIIKIPGDSQIFNRSIGGALSELDMHLKEKYNTSVNRLIAENHRKNGRRRQGNTSNGFDISQRIFRRSRK